MNRTEFRCNSVRGTHEDYPDRNSNSWRAHEICCEDRHMLRVQDPATGQQQRQRCVLLAPLILHEVIFVSWQMAQSAIIAVPESMSSTKNKYEFIDIIFILGNTNRQLTITAP